MYAKNSTLCGQHTRACRARWQGCSAQCVPNANSLQHSTQDLESRCRAVCVRIVVLCIGSVLMSRSTADPQSPDLLPSVIYYFPTATRGYLRCATCPQVVVMARALETMQEICRPSAVFSFVSGSTIGRHGRRCPAARAHAWIFYSFSWCQLACLLAPHPDVQLAGKRHSPRSASSRMPHFQQHKPRWHGRQRGQALI